MTDERSSPVAVALETATDRLSVAAARGEGAAPIELRLEGARRHTSGVLPLLERLLHTLDAKPAEIARVVVSDGPGSFTGLRVGAAVAKALATAGGAELRAASTLLVRAAAHAKPGQRVLAVSHALRGEAFVAAWGFGSDGAIEALLLPRAMRLEDVASLPAVEFAVGEAPAPILDALEQRGIRIVGPAWPSAVTLLRLVGRVGGAMPVDPERWEPDYGRPAEAQIRWEQSHGRSFPSFSPAPQSGPTGDTA